MGNQCNQDCLKTQSSKQSTLNIQEINSLKIYQKKYLKSQSEKIITQTIDKCNTLINKSQTKNQDLDQSNTIILQQDKKIEQKQILDIEKDSQKQDSHKIDKQDNITKKILQNRKNTVSFSQETKQHESEQEPVVKYKGERKNKMRHGYGVQVWPDNSYYEGHWENNKACGQGRFYHSDGDIYEGEWDNDMANGFGRYYSFNGAIYEGNWLDDQQDGFGKEKWEDGCFFEGLYYRGNKNGLGKYSWADGSHYEGLWLENNINGQDEYQI